ncbi:hypothetical protein BC477_19930 [Clavibacter michiganensis subsp. michiganensis]|uniref:Uncharacterized protein n=1 Tax=Clavibacter michiganensis subsp. michiganensis TaxID=33013 RepID=A0A251XD36_CLAMM|nr:hypothetical protein BC477_19930 [Clavibacter michiganensis subsp. michiganensis]OUD99959.1 hypothetical protein CMMCAS07_19470 [Clavibacter michiganensis subsp. michiganensis]
MGRRPRHSQSPRFAARDPAAMATSVVTIAMSPAQPTVDLSACDRTAVPRMQCVSAAEKRAEPSRSGRRSGSGRRRDGSCVGHHGR